MMSVHCLTQLMYNCFHHNSARTFLPLFSSANYFAHKHYEALTLSIFYIETKPLVAFCGQNHPLASFARTWNTRDKTTWELEAPEIVTQYVLYSIIISYTSCSYSYLQSVILEHCSADQQQQRLVLNINDFTTSYDSEEFLRRFKKNLIKVSSKGILLLFSRHCIDIENCISHHQ